MRTILSGLSIVGAMLIAAPAGAFEPTTDAEKLLVGWLEEAGCALSQDDFMDKAMSGPGVSGSELMKARRAMTKDGVIARGPNNSMTLTAGAACSGTEVAEPNFDSDSEQDVLVRKLIVAFEENNCVLTERGARTIFEADGMTRAQLDIAGEALEDAGAFKEVDGGLQLTIGSCRGFVAAAPEGDDRTRVMAMFEANDCALTEEQLPDAAAQFKVSRKQFRPVAKAMEASGELVEDGDVLRLKSGAICDPSGAKGVVAYTPKTDDERTIIRLFEENGCTLNEDQLPGLAAKYEIEKSAFRVAGRAMMKAGVFVEDGDDITLLGGKCAAGAPTESVSAVDQNASPRQKIVTIFEQNGCQLTEDQAMDLFPKAGLDLDRDGEVVEEMFKSGELVEVKDNSARLVTGDVCKNMPDPTRDAVVAAFVANDCVLTEQLFEDAIAKSDFDPDAAEAIIEEMIEAGDVVFIDETDQARLVTGDVCSR